MTNKYIEITRINSITREFFNENTGKIIKCICPIILPRYKSNDLCCIEREINYKDCQIHGW